MYVHPPGYTNQGLSNRLELSLFFFFSIFWMLYLNGAVVHQQARECNSARREERRSSIVINDAYNYTFYYYFQLFRGAPSLPSPFSPFNNFFPSFPFYLPFFHSFKPSSLFPSPLIITSFLHLPFIFPFHSLHTRTHAQKGDHNSMHHTSVPLAGQTE